MRKLSVAPVAACVLAISATLLAAPPSEQIPDRSPLAVVAAEGSPLQLVDMLRKAGHTVGLVLHFETWLEIHDHLLLPEDTVAVAKPDPPELARVLRLFELTHPGWRAESDGDAIVIWDSTLEPRRDPPEAFGAQATSLYEAFLMAQRNLSSEVLVVEGSVSSILFGRRTATWPPDPGEFASRVKRTVSATSDSLVGLLTEIASVDPGTAWLLIRHHSPLGTYDTLSVRFSDGILVDFRWQLWLEPRSQGQRLE